MTSAPDRRLRRIAATLAGAVSLVYVTTAGGTMATGDGVAMLEAARSLIDRGALDVPPAQSSAAWRGVDGRYYTPFGIGQSLFDVPFVPAGRAATLPVCVALALWMTLNAMRFGSVWQTGGCTCSVDAERPPQVSVR
jgi:hypothetical protein